MGDAANACQTVLRSISEEALFARKMREAILIQTADSGQADK